jgi:hypothetical protein
VLCVTNKQRDDADIGSRTGLWSWKKNRITTGQLKMEVEMTEMDMHKSCWHHHMSWADLTISGGGILQSACKDVIAKMDLHMKTNRLSMKRAKQDQTQPTASTPQLTHTVGLERSNIMVRVLGQVNTIRSLYTVWL